MADELKIAEPVVEEELTYSQHMSNAELLCEKLNGFLRSRGFHLCEAVVLMNWQGLVVLSRSVMTNGADPNGMPIHLSLNVTLQQPWMVHKDERQEPAEILSKGLEIAEDAMTGQCAKMGVLRINYQAFIKRMSTTIAVPMAVPKMNGKSRILTP